MNIKRINMILIGLATFLIIIIVVMQVQDLSSKGVMVVKYSHDSARDSLHNKTALKFKRIVETQTEGKIQVEVYPEGELGSGSRMFKAVEKGIQEIALLPTATISREEPSLEILDLPYLFQDRESAYKILDGKIGDEILSSIKSNNIIGVQFYEDGFKKFTSNKPINKVEDFKDLKFRIMPSKILLEQYKCLGAQGIEVDFNNTYRFLESNILDGQENPLISIEDMNYKKVQKYLIDSDHGYLSQVLLFNKDWFQKLDNKYQVILMKAAKDVAIEERSKIIYEEKRIINRFEREGMTITKITKKDREKIRKMTTPVYKIYEDTYGSELLNSIYKEVNKK